MKLTPPATLLRHRAPALVLGAMETRDAARLVCTGIDAGHWPWTRLLEGTAQAGGLLAGLQPGGPGDRAVIAEYRDVAVHAAAHRGHVHFEARVERRLAGFWRCRCEALSADDRVLLSSRVTVAAER
jgi:hypothetical protein